MPQKSGVLDTEKLNVDILSKETFNNLLFKYLCNLLFDLSLWQWAVVELFSLFWRFANTHPLCGSKHKRRLTDTFIRRIEKLGFIGAFDLNKL